MIGAICFIYNVIYLMVKMLIFFWTRVAFVIQYHYCHIFNICLTIISYLGLTYESCIFDLLRKIIGKTVLHSVNQIFKYESFLGTNVRSYYYSVMFGSHNEDKYFESIKKRKPWTKQVSGQRYLLSITI